MVFPLMTTSDDETKWLPNTMSKAPCCTSAKLIVLGDSEPISGAGLALPQSGFRALLQPGRNDRANRTASDRTDVREGIEMLLLNALPGLWNCSCVQALYCRVQTHVFTGVLGVSSEDPPNNHLKHRAETKVSPKRGNSRLGLGRKPTQKPF